MKIAIIGGGIIGVAAAHNLLARGHEVVILDRQGFASEASQGNAGWIAHLDVLPLASSKAWKQIPRWLLDPLGPLAVRPAYAAKILPWMLRFVRASHPSSVSSSMEAIAALNSSALQTWEELLSETQLSGFLRKRGFLSVWDRSSNFAAADALFQFQRARGMDVEPLSAKEVRNLEPALGPKVVGGALYKAGCHVADPQQLTNALGAAAIQRGAELRQANVRSIQPEQNGVQINFDAASSQSFDRVVVAAGAWSKPLAADLGDKVPLDTERGYNTTFPQGTFGLSRPVVFEGHGFVTTPLDTGDRIGGSVEFGGLEAPPNFKRIDALLNRFREFVPTAVLSDGQQWMGFRPSMPDSLPVISHATSDRRVIYAFGHGHYGLTQAAVTGQHVAELIANREQLVNLRPYAADRF